MSMFGHVARISSDDPALRILSCGNSLGWERGRGRPLSTRLRRMEEFCRWVRTNREQAWALAKDDALARGGVGRGTGARY